MRTTHAVFLVAILGIGTLSVGCGGGGSTSSNAGLAAQEAYLKASNTEANDRFGYSVALSGDTLVVGAFQEDSSAEGVGPLGSRGLKPLYTGA